MTISDLTTATHSVDTIYFDGRCPLCSQEMASVKRRKNAEIALVDIHNIEDFTQLPEKNILLETLHLKTSDGKWLKGVEANVQAWSGTKRGILFKLAVLPGVKVASAFVYSHWATLRYKKMYCKNEGCAR